MINSIRNRIQIYTLWRIIWASEESNRVWCRNFSISSKKSVEFKHVKQCFLLVKSLQTNYYWRWILRSRNNWPIKWISFKWWGQTKMTSPKSFENQCDADSFLRLSWCCSLRIPSILPNCQQGILFKRYASLAWSYSQKETRIMGQQLLYFEPR